MTVNISKTATQTFSMMHQNPKPLLYYQNSLLESVDTFTYLGVVFDTKLSWNNHVKYINDRVSKRLTILKRLAGCLWGCARSTLVATYRTFILPVITYCCEPLITMSKSLMNRLETAQNQALRLITGAVKSTPIDSMLLLTNFKPLKIVLEERALIFYEKLLHLGDDFWSNYQNLPRNLKTQSGFIQRVLDCRNTFHLPDIVDKVLKPRNPMLMHDININIQLLSPVLKSETAPDILRALALETINTKYPSSEWLHIYTDGSFSIEQPNTGAGIFCELFSFYSPIGCHRTAFDGEVSAMRIALEQLIIRCDRFQKAVILSDSKSAIQSISQTHDPTSWDILDCQQSIKKLEMMDKSIVLQWIPGHCGLSGNDRADALAKKGAGVSQITRRNVPYSTIKCLIKNSFSFQHQLELQTRTASKSWSNLNNVNIPDWPRNEAVAMFRLITHHDCLGGHLFKIGVHPDPFCTLCGAHVTMDGLHISYCRALRGTTLVERYWEARSRMRQ